MEKSKLLLNTLAKFFAGIILVGILLFLPAGTFDYFNGRLFIALLFFPMMKVLEDRIGLWTSL